MLGEEDVLSSQCVDSTHILIAKHRICLTRPCLAIGEAGDFGSLKCGLNKWLDETRIELLISGVLRECGIKIEGEFLHVLGKVDLKSKGLCKVITSVRAR